MEVYWTIADIPELTPMPQKERQRIWSLVRGKAFHHWQAWAALLTPVVFGTAGIELTESFGLWYAGAVIGSGAAAFLFVQVVTHLARPYIREQIATEGELRSGASNQSGSNCSSQTRKPTPKGRE